MLIFAPMLGSRNKSATWKKKRRKLLLCYSSSAIQSTLGSDHVRQKRKTEEK